MISQVLNYPIADILFTLYLLVYFPFEGIRSSLVSKVPKPALAVVLAAVSYGAGHGYKSFKQFAGSIGVSLAFTIGYALTGSLWWLIVLHAAAPTMMFFAVRKLNQATSVEVISA